MGNCVCCVRRRQQTRKVTDPKKLKRGESVFDQHPWLRKLQSFLITASLLAILFGYSFLGAAVFVALESGNEQRAIEEYRVARVSFLDDITNVTLALGTVDVSDVEVEQVRDKLDDLLHDFEEVMEEALCKNHASIAKKNATADVKWNFFGALFFSATVISTIGYGNIAPVTVGGRVFCMVYAVFGIALLLLVLASIGTLLARGATLGYRRIRNRCKKKTNKDEPDVVTFQRDRRSQEIMDDTWRSMGGEKGGGGGGEGDDDSHVVDLRSNKKNGESSEASQKRHSKGDKLEEAIEPVKLDDAQIPISIVLVFAFVYICFLALLLHTWEEQWDYFEAFYFSFITLTTIGFGDLVPLHQKNLLACTFFILLGMAIMSMCIALAQEMIIKKVAWLSRKIGVAFASHRKRPSDESES